MNFSLLCFRLGLLLGSVGVGVAAGVEDLEARVKVARQLARERNDRALVEEVEKAGREVRSGDAAKADAALRAVEVKVGLDAGGWSMAGQRLFHPTEEMLARLKAMDGKLPEAMRSGEEARVRTVTGEMLAVLGEEAGVPDGRRPGWKGEARPVDGTEGAKLFLDALETQGKYVRQLMRAEPLPDQMVRIYGYVLEATTAVRPAVAQTQPGRLAELDRLTRGVAALLLKLQQADGHFPFPDLRGKNIRFGDMISKQVESGKVVVRDGWVVSADPDGGSQFDTGVCGRALLRAGQVYGDEGWTKAGLRAADWALGQPCCANFNYNAFSVALLAEAWKASRDTKYLDGAWQKFSVGVAPGQAPNGRWIDSHNARTVYHVIILRGLGDLMTVLPTERATERAEVDRVTRRAVKALLDEFDAMGQTVDALPELQTLAALYPEDERLRKAVEKVAGGIAAKCTDGRRVKMGVQPDQLAALARLEQ